MTWIEVLQTIVKVFKQIFDLIFRKYHKCLKIVFRTVLVAYKMLTYCCSCLFSLYILSIHKYSLLI